MNGIVYLLFVSVFLLDYLAQFAGGAGRLLRWSPEFCSIFATLAVVFRVTQTKELLVHPKYLVLFAVFLLLAMAGVVLNSVQPGAVVAGLRTFFKYFPFFVLPAVFLVSERTLSTQLKFLLALSLIQLPVSTYQRFVQFKGFASGDPISGTLNISSIMSSYLVCVVAVLFAFYLNRRISLLKFLAIMALLLFPTTLNETKGTFVLLPFAILIPALYYSIRQGRLSAMIPVAGFVALLLIGFIVLYNAQLGGTGSTRDLSLTEYLLSERYKHTMLKGAEGTQFETAQDVGRLDSILLAYQNLSEDATKLLLGLGIGNVSESFSEVLAGNAEQYAHLGPTTTGASYLLWETGIIGLLAVIAGYLFVFNDARHLSRADGLPGILALGWTAVTAIYMISLLYKNFWSHNVMGYVFWYFSGYIATMRLRWEYSMAVLPMASPQARFQQ